MAGDIDLLQQLLDGGDLVGLLINFDMCQHKGRIDREGAQHLFGLGVIEIVEAAFKRFSVKGDEASTGAGAVRSIQTGGVFAKDTFNVLRLKPLQNITNSSMCRWSFPTDSKGFIETLPVDFE